MSLILKVISTFTEYSIFIMALTFPTMEVLVQFHVTSCVLCCGQSGTTGISLSFHSSHITLHFTTTAIFIPTPLTTQYNTIYCTVPELGLHFWPGTKLVKKNTNIYMLPIFSLPK